MELSCKDQAYREELPNVVIWDRDKFNNASFDDIRKDFKRQLLIPEMGDDEINFEEDTETEARKHELRHQKKLSWQRN